MMEQEWIRALQSFSPIGLEEMEGIRLMNRTDTKYVTTLPVLGRLLEMTAGEYRVQEVEGRRNLPYYTLYYDTPERDMFRAHQNGKQNRQKVRIRSYLTSGLHFLEVKNKTNKGRTHKQRIRVASSELTTTDCRDFLAINVRYPATGLCRQLENRFHRITLVNRAMTERLTIDTGLCFHNLQTGNDCRLDPLVIIELKRDGHTSSPVADILRWLHVHPAGFSKYCMGTVLTNAAVKHNRLKPRLHSLERLLNR